MELRIQRTRDDQKKSARDEPNHSNLSICTHVDYKRFISCVSYKLFASMRIRCLCKACMRDQFKILPINFDSILGNVIGSNNNKF